MKAASGDIEGAVADVQKAIALNANDFDAYLFLGALHEHKGEYDLAIAKYDTALTLAPSDPRVFLRRGAAQYAKKNYDAALKDLTAVIKLQPDNIQAYDYRGGVYYTQGENEKGIADYTEAIRLEPKTPSHVHNRGVLYLRSAKPKEAIADLSKAVELGSPNALADLADAHIAGEDLRAALMDLDKLTQSSPDNANVWRVRGNVQRYLGDERMVIADYERAVALDPSVANKMLLWRAMARTGDQAAALKAFDATFDKEPSGADEYNTRCWYLTLLGEPERALVYCNRALALEPDQYSALDSRGLIHHALGQYDAALRDYNRALEINPEGWSTYLRRSRLLDKMGQAADAARDYQTADKGFGPDKSDQYYSHLETQDALLNTARRASGTGSD